MALEIYKKKRRLSSSREPKASIPKKIAAHQHIFVLQKHFATHLHFDFRIEVGGVLKSWAIPKGLSKSTALKRLGLQTEDHPLAYAKFEGVIPEGHYGAGKVIIWDKGVYHHVTLGDQGKILSLRSCLKKGHVEIWLKGKKFKGGYALIRLQDKGWLFIKMNDTKLAKKLEDCGYKVP